LTVRGLLHVHSTFSYDARNGLDELAAWGERRGLDAILLTEHVNGFDEAKMDRYVREVDALAGRRCRLVPGLEFAVKGGFHILGCNLRRWSPTTDPAGVARFIRDHGGIGILAHPARYRGRWPAGGTLDELHGIEVWNARYDGRFLPSGHVVAQSMAVRATRRTLRFFGGQDLHEADDHRIVVTEADSTDGLDGFLRALARGEFVFGHAPVSLCGVRDPGLATVPLLKLGHWSYRVARRMRDSLRA